VSAKLLDESRSREPDTETAINDVLREAKRRFEEATGYPEAAMFRVVDDPALQQQISLTPDEFKILFRVAAGRTVREFLADVPAPRSWVTGDLNLVRPLAEQMQLIIKPYMGHRGAGITIVRDPSELASVPQPDAPVIIQEYIPGTGQDLKVYVVGEEVFAVRKPFSETSFTVPGIPVPVSEEVRQLTLRAGKACGLGLYGLDIIESPNGPYVVDVNYFPGYKGVPDVAPLIADYIDRYAKGEVTLESPRPLPAASENVT
jgi:hypothetical protein